MARSAMAGWEERFDDYVERLGDVLGHADRRAPLRAYPYSCGCASVSRRPQWQAWATAWWARRQKDQARTKPGVGGAPPSARRTIKRRASGTLRGTRGWRGGLPAPFWRFRPAPAPAGRGGAARAGGGGWRAALAPPLGCSGRPAARRAGRAPAWRG